MSRIYVIHENNAWVEPLRAAFMVRGLPFEEWYLDAGTVDLGTVPPEGVFYNRMSASSHTRGHRYAPEYTAAIIAWLERHGRRVLNGGRALQLEVSKVAQYAALESYGVRIPRTVAAVGGAALVAAAESFPRPFITKHNRAGKGLGVRLFHDAASLAQYVDGPEFEASVDGVTLLQQYIKAPEPFITRVEFVGGRLLYAVRVDTSQGFELCPADACRVDDTYCPAGEAASTLFRIVDGFEDPLVATYERLLADNGIQIAGIEFVADQNGTPYTYDINTNTNYNSEAESRAGRSGMGAIAEYLGEELAAVGKVAS
ncbi:MAG: alpha-L-glutamate ligase [Acidobacteriota bacterium]|nr:alpha-L-glutamate ligase [Acidobacteriota bacterium]